jgi:ribosomal protein S12 methylthiotransferase
LILVNTCAFIEEATTESVDTLLEMAEAKQAGETRWLAAVGCLPEKYREELAREMPELDLVVGVPDFGRLDELLENLTRTGERQISFAPHPKQYAGALARLLSTPPHRAFLKVADGCSNAAPIALSAVCVVRSAAGPLADIGSEARELVAGGVVELDMVAQDLTLYGSD